MSAGMLAYHYDLKRAMWTREYMDAMADRLRGWGFNAIVYEMEDKFRFARHPALAHPEAPSHEETSSFVRACRAKGIEVIPMVQSLGHAESVVGNPAYAHLREDPAIGDQYDPTSEEARALLRELFDETLDVFQPKEFFHMGGDETWALGKSAKCAPLVEKMGIGGLYLQHMLPLFEHVRKRGLRPIIWADMVLTHPEIIQAVPRYVVMMDWDYWTDAERPNAIMIWGGGAGGRGNRHVDWKAYPDAAGAPFRQHLEKYAVDERTRKDGTFRTFYCTDALRDNGFDAITASANRCHGDMAGTPAHGRHLPNCFYSARKGMGAGLGNLVTSWAVRHNHPELCMPATFAASRAARGEAAFDAAALADAFTADFHGAAMPEFAEAVGKAQARFTFGESHFMGGARRQLREGRDPVAAHLAQFEAAHGGRDGAIEYLGKAAGGYAEARAAFAAMEAKAVRNAAGIGLWIEGTDLNAFYADVLLAAMAGRLRAASSGLLERLNSLRANTRALFARTYTPQGVEDELELRYGFCEEYLTNGHRPD